MAKRIVYKNNIAVSEDDIKLHFLKSYSLKWHNNIIQSKGNINFVFSHFVHEEYTLEQFIELENNVLSCESAAVIYDPSGTCETKDNDAILNHPGVLLTDNIYLEPCKDGPSFINEFNIEKVDCGFVVGYGTYNGSKIVVCKRPDIRGITDEAIHEFSKHIKETFDK